MGFEPEVRAILSQTSSGQSLSPCFCVCVHVFVCVSVCSARPNCKVISTYGCKRHELRLLANAGEVSLHAWQQLRQAAQLCRCTFWYSRVVSRLGSQPIQVFWSSVHVATCCKMWARHLKPPLVRRSNVNNCGVVDFIQWTRLHHLHPQFYSWYHSIVCQYFSLVFDCMHAKTFTYVSARGKYITARKVHSTCQILQPFQLYLVI